MQSSTVTTAGNLHPGTHTLPASTIPSPNNGNNNNINNNNNTNNNNASNNNELEYRVTVKQKKKQTAACDACKRRRRKCSGTQPCAYCTEKRCECNYSQQHKRGKRKATDIASSEPFTPQENQVGNTYNLTKAHKLWTEAERFSTVDKFCGIRWWWKNLLDVQGIKQSSSPAHRAQLSIINAWMARIVRDHGAARHHYDIARNISLNGFGDSDPVSTTTAYLLLSDYAPSDKEYIHYSWKSANRIKPGTSTERHVFFYAKCFQACCNDQASSYSERLEQLLSFGSDALQSSVVDLWDTVFFMSIKAYVALMSKLESFLSGDCLRTLSNLSLSKPDRDGLMMDLRVGEVLMQSQIHMFGFEYQTCLHFTKIMLMWAGGEREKAVQEAIRYVQNIEQYGENALFLVEVKNLMMPLMILNEVGITAYNNTTVGIIETICKETDQPDMLTELLPLFNELRVSASTIHSQPPHPLMRNTSSILSMSPQSPLSSSSSSSSSPSPNGSPLIEELDNQVQNGTGDYITATPMYGYPANSPRNLLNPEPQQQYRQTNTNNNTMYTPSPHTPFSFSPGSDSSSSYNSSPSPPTPSSPPQPPQRLIPAHYNPPINQNIPTNLHRNHPLISQSNVINTFYNPATSNSATLANPANPTPAGASSGLVFPFPPSTATYDSLNWDQPNPFTPSSSTSAMSPPSYAELLLSDNSYPSPAL